MQAQRSVVGNDAYLDIHIAYRLVLATVQSMPRSGLIEDRQRHTAWLCARLVHHIPAGTMGIIECKVKTDVM